MRIEEDEIKPAFASSLQSTIPQYEVHGFPHNLAFACPKFINQLSRSHASLCGAIDPRLTWSAETPAVT